ncbi:MAG: Brp/Blh family beta-carotene 15,15'-dioxygenase [Ilumatobacter sp.]|uniref:Brp/Blh family beta-carotene 15,15'-dioxygenase n=1 Tax=Ilumatobacter sp. TaxID=1967498 RepID=UPI002608ABB0|nr:Brp/Blh family beta-carotene 15,15'-dioxygenase [Ilumatobacter sp.]MDJ0769630.1 Brp/Blh family beta-carotene 15,15'-dioxygenase [Ilumatobacter sp.]
MTRRLHPNARAELVTGPLFWPLTTATVATAFLSAALEPDPVVSATIAIAVVATLGLPHGAADHAVMRAITGVFDPVRFHVRYVAGAAGYAALWLTVPAVALIGFLLVSAHHFGQSDLAHLRQDGSRMLQWSRGVFVVAVPLVAHTTAVGPIVERLAGVDPSTWSWLAASRPVVIALLIGQHLAAVAFLLRRTPALRLRQLVVTISLTTLFVAADPLIGFAVYFGAWHSLGHLMTLSSVVGTGGRPIVDVVRIAAPRTLVVAVLAAAGAALCVVAGRADLIVPSVFVMLSLVTVPHAVVVERMWRDDRSAVTDQPLVATR